MRAAPPCIVIYGYKYNWCVLIVGQVEVLSMTAQVIAYTESSFVIIRTKYNMRRLLDNNNITRGMIFLLDTEWECGID